MGKVFYTADEATQTLGLTPDELKRLVQKGRLREFRDAGKIFFKAEDIQSLAEERNVEPIDLIVYDDTESLGAELLDELYPGTSFEYEALNSSGQEVRGTLSADTKEEAVAQVRSMGHFPTRVRENGERPLRVSHYNQSDSVTISWKTIALFFMATTALLTIVIVAMATRGTT